MQALRIASLAAYRALFGWRRTTALAEGWRIMRQHREVLHDLCVMGHLFEPDIDPATGRLYEGGELTARAARKSFALMLLARGEVTQDELNHIRMENRNDAFDYDDAGSDA
ncbi:MAG: hypothetical protein V4712_17695 [Pseudomonadota bacterium]